MVWLLLSSAMAIELDGPHFIYGHLGFAAEIEPAGDVNGDGFDDLLVSRDGSGLGFYLYTGSPHGLVRASTHVAGDVVRALAGGVDVNGDGYPDAIAARAGGDEGRGCLLVWFGGPAGLATDPDDETCGGMSVGLGHRLAAPGDMNGDGYADVVSLDRNFGLYLYAGGPDGLEDEPLARVLAPANMRSWRGANASRVAGVGDVNGDGLADVALGYRMAEERHVLNEDAAFVVFLGGEDGLSSRRATLYADRGGLGEAVAAAGDVNGDGYGDVVAGNHFSRLTSDYGLAGIYWGSAAGLDPTPQRFLGAWGSIIDFQRFGSAVAGGADFDGDGLDEVAVSAPSHYNSGSGRAEGAWGAVYLYRSADGYTGGGEFPFYAGPGFAALLEGKYNMGLDLALPGDLNGDGCPDLVANEGDERRSRWPLFWRLDVWYGVC